LLGCLRCCMAFNIQESDIWDRWAETASLNLVCFPIIPLGGDGFDQRHTSKSAVILMSFWRWQWLHWLSCYGGGRKEKRGMRWI
jgi:hypothetical protein